MTAISNPGNSLKVSRNVLQRLEKGDLSHSQVKDFQDFLNQVDQEFLQHRIILHNPYTRWFQKGEATDDELRHFIRQFSVFSNEFLIAALLKVVNAPSLEQARAGKEIVMNELGVIYRKPSQEIGKRPSLNEEEKDREGDPDLVSTEGTVDGGVFRFRAAHFEWLLAVGKTLGLGFQDLGKRKHGRPATLHFCDELKRLYGSDDPQLAEGASFAVENWAAAGFWQELEDGLFKIKEQRHPKMKLAFFTWHNRVEAQHADHTMDELEEVYFDEDFNQTKFFRGGNEILDAVSEFWEGLENDRLHQITK